MYKVGSTLNTLRNHVQGMNPENKGLSIGNCPELAQAHNSHAVPRARRRFEKNNVPTTGTRYTGEAFHFVSYVPINDRLIELDGLKKYPIDHGPIPDPDNWTEKLRQVITERLGIATGGGVPYHDIRFALMVLVPDTRCLYQSNLTMLKTNREIVITALRQLLQICYSKKVAGARVSTGDAEDKEEAEDCIAVEDIGATLEVDRLEKEVLQVLDDEVHLNLGTSALEIKPTDHTASRERVPNKPLIRLSRGSSMDCQPKSPFQSNPLLTAHDYSKSPMMEGCEEDEEEEEERMELEKENEGRMGDGRINQDETNKSEDSTQENGETIIQDKLDKNGEKSQALFSLSLSENKPEFNPQQTKLQEPHFFTPRDLLTLLRRIETEIYVTEGKLNDEVDTHKKYIVDDCRRVHNYDEFITTFISMLGEQSLLGELVEHGLGYRKEDPALAGRKDPGQPGKKDPGQAGRKEQEKKTTAGDPSRKTVVPRAPVKGRKKKKRLDESESDWSDESRESPVPSKPVMKVLYNDSSLPKGWKRKVKKKAGTGMTSAKYDVYIINPQGKQFKSKQELKLFLEKQETDLEVDDFDFSVSGIKRSGVKSSTKRRK
ncbi:ubiquitin carboxyl-terminal hydrolase calypso isoform X2 [Eurytemora carolleeae]|uniref:ubiquitin carboxyl-terminal hydrolase calypso isoform X2 n=1 Tax=Eurytemora carolleeae TaxID=1294199 RepID=UPI000C756D1B|nr:ubiquitin carboxyl-terminal hydrolase calypso isoform X2 [Eurytemora carolleeae]|eukprot:XP_023343869.1 ubiquitin carboxyl-terminal hydrolase calypso-like isoform X2 [Eurytemora affinis]